MNSYRSNFLHAVDYRIKLLLKFQDCNTALKTETYYASCGHMGIFLEHKLIFSLGYIMMSPRESLNEKKMKYGLNNACILKDAETLYETLRYLIFKYFTALIGP